MVLEQEIDILLRHVAQPFRKRDCFGEIELGEQAVFQIKRAED